MTLNDIAGCCRQTTVENLTIVKMSSCGSNAGMETSAPSSVPLQLARQPDAASNQSHPELSSGRLAAPDFVMKCIEVRAVQWPEILKFIIRELHYCTFELEAANDA